jgi:hypothetical protein
MALLVRRMWRWPQRLTPSLTFAGRLTALPARWKGWKKPAVKLQKQSLAHALVFVLWLGLQMLYARKWRRTSCPLERVNKG